MFDVTYKTYTDTYGGDLTEVAFTSVLAAATRHVRWMCGGHEPVDVVEEAAYARAACACADAFVNYGEGEMGGFSLGEFKMTNYENRGTTGAELASDAVVKEFTGTSLPFCGVR